MISSKANILLIDSATSVLRVGISSDGETVSFLENADRYKHAEFIFSLLEQVLEKNGVARGDISAIIIATGPGSFTGLRVGMASAKGLAVSLDIPLIGVSLYQAIAPRLYAEKGRTVVVIPSRRDEYYAGVVDGKSFDDEGIAVCNTSEIHDNYRDCQLFGIGCELSAEDFPGCSIIMGEEFSIRLEDFLQAGLQRLRNVGEDDLSRLEPLYIQQFRAGKKL